MAKGKQETTKKTGRPSKYTPECDAQAAKLCRLGATDADLADFFGVAVSTLNLWKLKHHSFSESLTRSKDELDSLVERSLFQRAVGYSHKAVKIFMPAGKDAPVFADFIEHFPPDPTSMIFWLKNRQPDRWRDKRETGDDEGDAPAPVKIEVQVVDARKHADEGV